MEWIRRGSNVESERLVRITGADKLLIDVLLNRGFSSTDIQQIFLYPSKCLLDPKLLTMALEVAKVIIEFIKNNPNGMIVIFADYDTDGITSGYIMSQVLSELHDNVLIYYPNRSEGYGLNMDFCKKVVERECEQGKLVITVDNGTAAIEEVKYLKENGVEVIITDHHTPKETLPDCLIVNPHVHNDEKYKHLAGCGVAFKVCQVIQELLGLDTMYYYSHALAIGTIADMMPMTKENIALCMTGRVLMNSDECPTPLKAFKKYFGKDSISFIDIGWEIAPMINACGRMGDTAFASKIFLDADLSTQEALEQVIIEMVKINECRKDITKIQTEHAFKHIDESQQVIVHVVKDCPEGIAGVVANKILERYQRPCIVLSEHNGVYGGSGRGINGYSILKILEIENAKGNLLSYGGHSAAAGLSLRDLDKFTKSVQETILEIEREEVAEDAPNVGYTDGLLTLKDLNKNTLNALNMIPYDKEVLPQPIFEWNVEITSCTPAKNNNDNGWLTIKDNTGELRYWVKDIHKIWNELGKPKQAKIIGNVKAGFGASEGKVVIEIIDIKGVS